MSGNNQNDDDLKRRLRKHNDERLYLEADELMCEAADRIEQLEAALRGMVDAYNDLCDESEPNYRSFKFRQEKWEAANAALGKGKP